MFESLTAKQISDIEKEVIKLKFHMIKEKGLKGMQLSSVIQMTVYKYISELKKKNIVVTKDIEKAAEVFALLPINDLEFLKLKKQYNSDYNKIAELYCTSSIYAKYRYKLLLLKRRGSKTTNVSTIPQSENITLTKKRVLG